MSAEQDLTPIQHLAGPAGACLLSLSPVWERLTVIEHGEVWDGELPHEWESLEADERVHFLFDPDRERVKAVIVHKPFEVDLEELEDAEELWSGPTFSVPMLGTGRWRVGEIIAAVQGRFEPEEPTVDAAYFHLAVQAEDPEEAIALWRAALQAGDMKAHFGLGYTLHDLGRHREACDHLRVYTELTPHNAWAWCWLGQVCEKIGESAAAINAYRRALELERRGGMETDAGERLEELVAR